MMTFFRPDKMLVACFNSEKSPYLHLAREEYLLRNFDKFGYHSILYLWQSSPSVIIGKYQNPFKEVNLTYLHQHRVQLARRISGGGTIYSDEGNLNICIVSRSARADAEKHLLWLKDLLFQGNEPVEITEKFDLLLEGDKISGSAFKQLPNVSMHHFTLLLNANLEHLSQLLFIRTHDDEFQTSAVSSRIRQVKNIADRMALGFTLQDVITKIQSTATPSQKIVDFISEEGECGFRVERCRELQSDAYLYYSTPPFVQVSSGGRRVSVGKNLQLESNLQKDYLELVKKYGYGISAWPNEHISY